MSLYRRTRISLVIVVWHGCVSTLEMAYLQLFEPIFPMELKFGMQLPS